MTTIRTCTMASLLTLVTLVGCDSRSDRSANQSTDPSDTQTAPDNDGSTATLNGRDAIELIGSPFRPVVRTDGTGEHLTHTYRLRNRSDRQTQWRAWSDRACLSFDPPSGTLEPGGETTMTSVVNPTVAATAGPGQQQGVIYLSNSLSRQPSRTLIPIPLVPYNPPVATLMPGGGFSGSTPVPGRVGSGAGSDAKVIAHWDVVPYQRYSTPFSVGVIAFHRNGIDRVDFSLNRGPWTSVRQMTLNPRTSVYEYWAVLDPTLSQDGPVEIRAIAYPTAGVPRLLAPLRMVSNGGGTVPQHVRYVGTNGSDSSGNGTNANPYRTIMKAVSSIRQANGNNRADGGIVYLKMGDFEFGPKSAAPISQTEHEWITVKPAPWLSKADCRITRYGRIDTKLVHLEDLEITTQVATSSNNTTLPVDLLWVENCEMVGRGRTNNVTFFQQFHWTDIYVTDSVYRDNEDAQEGAEMLRNVHARNLGSDAFGDSRLVVNCTVKDINAAGTNNHPDVYQFSGVGATKENYIIYGLMADNCISQGIFADDLSVLNNVAFVNVLLDQATNNYKSQWKDVSTDHLLLWNVSLLNQDFMWRSGNIRNASVHGNVWHRMVGSVPTNSSVFESNHYVDWNSFGAKTPGSDFSTGNPLFLDPAANLYVPTAQSVLRGRLQPPKVPGDLLNRTRLPAATIGAVE